MGTRPLSFEEVKGHSAKVAYLREQLAAGTLPHFILFEGEEGLGKTSLAELVAIDLVYGVGTSPEKEHALQQFIVSRKALPNIKRFAMSVEGGKDAAKEVLSEFNTALVRGNKVIICDECHAMSDAAQDVLLTATDTGCIPDNLYLIMLTTEKANLKPTLLSRMVPIHLNRLKSEDLLQILREEVMKRGLEIQGGDSTLNIIAEWSEYKPRAAVSLLGAFGQNKKVSANLVKELIGYVDVKDVLPLVSSLAGSFTWGLSYIDELTVDKTFVEVVVELLKVKCGCPSYKLGVSEVKAAREQMQAVPEECLRKFTYLITGAHKCTRNLVTSAFIQSHISADRVGHYSSKTLDEEKIQKADVDLKPVKASMLDAVPTLDDLLSDSTIVQQ